MNNFYIILVEPAFPGNIGSVARAMKNMGFKHLLLVEPCAYLSEEAKKLAVNAIDILENAKVYSSLENAAKDLNILVATTGKKGKYRKPVHSSIEIVPVLKKFDENTKIGIVFGRERIGLLNKEIDFCHLITEIPSSEEYPCLNLAQSVMIFCYELFKDKKYNFKPSIEDRVKVEELEKFFKIFEKLLLDIDFLDKENPEFKMRAIRKIFSRCFLTKNELNLLYGIVRQVRNMEHILLKKIGEKNNGE